MMDEWASDFFPVLFTFYVKCLVTFKKKKKKDVNQTRDRKECEVGRVIE